MWDALVTWAQTPLVVTYWLLLFFIVWLIWFVHDMVTRVTTRLDHIAVILENRFDTVLDIFRRFETREFDPEFEHLKNRLKNLERK